MFRGKSLCILRIQVSSFSTCSFRRSSQWQAGRQSLRAKVGISRARLDSLLDSLFDGDIAFDTFNAEKIATVKMRKLSKKPKQQTRWSAAGSVLTQGDPEEILSFEAYSLLSKYQRETESEPPESESLTRDQIYKPPKPGVEFELDIEELSSTSQGLGYSPLKDHVFVVPQSVPGDRVLVKTYPQKDKLLYTQVDMLKVLRPSPMRDNVTPGCKYFGTCSGCQLQMIPYHEQLMHKKRIVEKAFKNFSNLDPSVVPPVGDTIGSPLQYGYRTKLTPHYNRPRDGRQPPEIGFIEQSRNRRTVDIEQCPIGTPVLNEGLKAERKRIRETFSTKRQGATILLRESTSRMLRDQALDLESKLQESPNDSERKPTEANSTASLTILVPSPISVQSKTSAEGKAYIENTYPTYTDVKTYVTEHQAIATEYVGNFTFQTRANSFFQNNNSVLPTFINYVRDNCIPKHNAPSDPPIKYLLDAYCGSGLFSVCLSPLFSSVLGIDVDVHGVEMARVNALANVVPNAGFIAASAEDLFADVPYPPAQSLVVIDPPRKGASVDFLTQLCKFGPKRVVYVSCNVHTQARDVGMLVAGFGGEWRYEIESLRGFDFFPQTGHVEGVCFLNRVENKKQAQGVLGDKSRPVNH